MSGSSHIKLKFLYILKILNEKSDEENPISMKELIEELNKYGINAERKSIYSDIKLLQDYGIDICKVSGGKYGYFIDNRDFEIPELKLMIDAVQVARFITPKKSRELIKKIQNLTSSNYAKKLESQVFIDERIKYQNEEIYYIIDRIQTAIMNNRMISFKYYQYNMNKERVYKRNGNDYNVNPYALSYLNGHYYLIGNYNKYNDISHYRIDRICNVNILDEKRRSFSEISSYNNYFNIADYDKKVYGAFSGTTEDVVLRFHNSLLDVVIDEFGRDISIIKDGDEYFKIRTKVITSNGFISWLFAFWDEVEVLEPTSLREKVKGTLKNMNDIYK